MSASQTRPDFSAALDCFVRQIGETCELAVLAMIMQGGVPVVAQTLDGLVRSLKEGVPDIESEEWVTQVRSFLPESPLLKEPERLLRAQSEIFLTRAVDGFNAFLIGCLGSIFRARPEILRSGKMIKAEDALRCASMEELVDVLAQRELAELSYKGFRDTLNYLTSKLGLKIDARTQRVRLCGEAIAVRNIVVHNGGLVSERFLRDADRSDLEVGEQYPLDLRQAMSLMSDVSRFGLEVYEQFLVQFGVGPEGEEPSSDGG